LLDATIDQARDAGLIAPTSPLAAIDSTGMESRHVSRYFSHRRGCHYSRYPKLSAIVDTASHLFLGLVVDRGPKNDLVEFVPLVRQAHRRQRFETLLGDVAYDSEGNLDLLATQHRVAGVFPPRRGQSANKPPSKLRTPRRRTLAQQWPAADYGQRWQIETSFSMLKRLLGSALSSRRRHAIDREITLRVLTLNLMILLSTAIHLFNRAGGTLRWHGCETVSKPRQGKALCRIGRAAQTRHRPRRKLTDS